ncbi:MAG: SDR family NAD(P)-dependent oxidoreductase, partial [Catenulispora sp.]|nr:SDR family NAD(P)-dependent oxidoreductase [Catenulispora sp.]
MTTENIATTANTATTEATATTEKTATTENTAAADVPEPGQASARVAVVTGGSRGIGRAVVERLAAEGYAVALAYAGRRDLAD